MAPAAFLLLELLLAVHLAAATKPPLSEVLALQSLYNDTNGTGWDWRSNTSYYGIPWNFSNIDEQDPCAYQQQWQGVTCNVTANGTTHVTNITLSFYNMCGSLPSDLNQLTELRILNLGYNYLSSSLPSTLGELSNLKRLHLNDNRLTGSLLASSVICLAW